MNEMYAFVEQAVQNYQPLQDELSKKIFWARLALEFDPSPENTAQLVSLGEQQGWLDVLLRRIPSILHAVERDHKKLILYGTNVTGRAIAARLMEMQADFYGFCGRRAKEFPGGLMGKPVLSPDYLFQHADEFYIILSASEAEEEILNTLRNHDFPQAHILFYPKLARGEDHQYFEFPSLFPPGTAFIDGGCLDCRTSYLFSDWCGGKYSKIFAFEPDPISCSICEQRLSEKKIRDFRLIRCGLSDHTGKKAFRADLYGCSHIVADGNVEGEHVVAVPVTTIDDTAGEEKIGFIKLDIEGSELDALHGAEKVISRDQPLLAVSVYHRRGDMVAIMDYLHRLVPEYHFWLRHYSVGAADTVLYASVSLLNEQ